ncbi:MAG: hypothetical protein HFE39_06595 [Clostridiales bacterium]|nr:hypothetical protein [Clostridiales bacterium]
MEPGRCGADKWAPEGAVNGGFPSLAGDAATALESTRGRMLHPSNKVVPQVNKYLSLQRSRGRFLFCPEGFGREIRQVPLLIGK